MLRSAAVWFSTIFRVFGALSRMTFGCIARIHNFTDALLEGCVSRLEQSIYPDRRLVSESSCSGAKSSQLAAAAKRRKKFPIRSRKIGLYARKECLKEQTKAHQLTNLKTRLFIPDLETVVTCDLRKAKKIVLSYEFTENCEAFDSTCEDAVGISCTTASSSLNKFRAFASKGRICLVPGVTMYKAEEDLSEDNTREVSINAAEKDKDALQPNGDAFMNLDEKMKGIPEIIDKVPLNLSAKIEYTPQVKDEIAVNLAGSFKNKPQVKDKVPLNLGRKIEDTSDVKDEVPLNLGRKIEDTSDVNNEVPLNLGRKIEDTSDVTDEVPLNLGRKIEDTSNVKDEFPLNLDRKIEDTSDVKDEVSLNLDEKIGDSPDKTGEVYLNLAGKPIDTPHVKVEVFLNTDENIGGIPGISDEISLNMAEKIGNTPELNGEAYLNLDEKIEDGPEKTDHVSLNLDGTIKDTQMKDGVSNNSDQKYGCTLEEKLNVSNKIFPQVINEVIPDPTLTSEPLDLSSTSQNNAVQKLPNSAVPENDGFKMPKKVSGDFNDAMLYENKIGEVTESHEETVYLFPERYDKNIEHCASKTPSGRMDIGRCFPSERVEPILENEFCLKSESVNKSIEKIDDKANKNSQGIDPIEIQTEYLSQRNMEIKSINLHSQQVKDEIQRDINSEIESSDETHHNGLAEKCVLKQTEDSLIKTQTLDMTLNIPKNEKSICSFKGVHNEHHKDRISDQSFDLQNSSDALNDMVSVCTLTELEKLLLVDSLNMPGNLKFEFSVGPPMSGSEILKNFSFNEDQYATEDENGLWESQEELTDPLPAGGNALKFDLSKFPGFSQTKNTDPETMTESEKAKQEAMHDELERTKEEFEKHVFLRDSLINSLERVIYNQPFQSSWDNETESSESVHDEKSIDISTSSPKQVENKYPFEVHPSALGGAFNSKKTELKEPKKIDKQETSNTGILKQSAKGGIEGDGTENACIQNTNGESLSKIKTLLEEFESRDENLENGILLQWINRRKVELRKHLFEPLCTVSHSESSPESNTESSPVQIGKKGRRRKQKKSSIKSEAAITDTVTMKRVNQNIDCSGTGRILTSRYVYHINTAERAGHEFDYRMATLHYLSKRMYGSTLPMNSCYPQYDFIEHDAKVRDAAAFNAFESAFKPIAEERCNENEAKPSSLKSIDEFFNVQNIGKKMCPFTERAVDHKSCDQKIKVPIEGAKKDVMKAENKKEPKGFAQKRKSQVKKSGEDGPNRYTAEKSSSFEIKNEASLSESIRQVSELSDVKVENESLVNSAIAGINSRKISKVPKLKVGESLSLFKPPVSGSNSEKSKLDEPKSLSLFKPIDTSLTQSHISEKIKLELAGGSPFFKPYSTSTSKQQLEAVGSHSESQVMNKNTNAYTNKKSTFDFDSQTDSTTSINTRKSVIVKNDQAARSGRKSENVTSIDSASSIKSQTSRHKNDTPHMVKDLQNMCEDISTTMPQQFPAATDPFYPLFRKDETGSSDGNMSSYREPPPYGLCDMYDLEPTTDGFEYELLQRVAAETASANSLGQMLEQSERRIMEDMNLRSLADGDQDEVSSAEASSVTCSEGKTKDPKKSQKKKWKSNKRHYK